MNIPGDLCKLSIVVPVYNGSAYISELFRQFAGQDMDGVELVLIDDGSTDDSYETLLVWREKTDFAVSVFHQENMGVSAARNFGVKMARGEYLTFVDVDDGIAPDYICALSRYIRQSPDVLVFQSRRVKSGELPGQPAAQAACQNRTKQDMLLEFIENPTRYGVYNLLVRREYLAENQIAFPVGYPYYEDYDYLIQLFAQTDQILRTEQVLYYYILREGSAMGRFNADRITCLALMKNRESWLKEHAPGFAPVFEKWGVARIYWSILWQAALAFPSYGDFLAFSRLTGAENYLIKLKGYPDKRVRLSTGAFLHCKPAYYAAVRMVGAGRSKVYPVKLQEIQPYLPENEIFY